MDCYLGFGSTITTAHKMGRKYIGIESNPETIKLVEERLNKVIEGETGGISKIVAWNGGGEYKSLKV